MTRKTKQVLVSYEPEADVMSWELAPGKIDYAEEAGNMVVHFSKAHKPILVEMLGAKNFFANSKKIFAQSKHAVKMAIPA